MVFFEGTLLTIVWLMQALNPLVHHEDVLNYIAMLTEVDPMRKQFYVDMRKTETPLISNSLFLTYICRQQVCHGINHTEMPSKCTGNRLLKQATHIHPPS